MRVDSPFLTIREPLLALRLFDCCVSSVKKYRIGTLKCHDHDILTLHQPIRLQHFEWGNENYSSQLKATCLHPKSLMKFCWACSSSVTGHYAGINSNIMQRYCTTLVWYKTGLLRLKNHSLICNFLDLEKHTLGSDVTDSMITINHHQLYHKGCAEKFYKIV